jgi:AsmA protein
MKKILFAVAGVIVLGVLALLAAPFFIPASVYEDQIEANATEALGREVTISGAPKLQLLPTRIEVSGLTVANADGFSDPYLARVDSAEIGVRLLALLSRRVEITEFILHQPDIRLETNEAGAANWILGTDSSEPTESEGGGSAPVDDISLGDVEIRDGAVTFRTAQGDVYRAEDADITLTLDSLDEPLTIAGTMRVQDQDATVDAVFGTPRSFARTGDANLALDLRVGENRADTDLVLGEGLAYEGNLDIDFPALRSLLSVAGATIETDQGFRSLRLKGPVSGTGDRIAFGQNTELTFDDISGTGALAIDISGARPRVTGNIAATTLDLTTYLPAETDGMKAAKSGTAAFPQWSEERVDLSALGAIDADLQLSADRIILPSLDIGRSVLALTVDNGSLRADVRETSLYGGRGQGVLTANVRRAAPTLGVDFELSGVEMAQFANDLLGLSRLAGRGNVRLSNLRTGGGSQAEWVRNLDGDVAVSLQDGVITGVNLGQIVREIYNTYTALRSGDINPAAVAGSISNLTTAARGAAEETDFSALLLDLGVANGTVSTRQLRLDGPYFAITGDATVNLAQQSLGMQLVPIIEAVEGEGMLQLPVPIQISGTFNDPKISVDPQTLIRGIAAKPLQDLLGRRGIELAPGQSTEDALRNRARSELENMLGRQRGDRPDANEEGDPQESPDSPVDEAAPAEETPPARPEDVLIERGLDAIFGGRDG